MESYNSWQMVWLLPFIEFEIASALSRAGIAYDASWGSSVPSDVVENIRSVLRTSEKSDIRSIPTFASGDEGRSARTDTAALAGTLRSHACKMVF